MIWINWTKIYL